MENGLRSLTVSVVTALLVGGIALLAAPGLAANPPANGDGLSCLADDVVTSGWMNSTPEAREAWHSAGRFFPVQPGTQYVVTFDGARHIHLDFLDGNFERAGWEAFYDAEGEATGTVPGNAAHGSVCVNGTHGPDTPWGDPFYGNPTPEARWTYHDGV